jgi:hypothetical protein
VVRDTPATRATSRRVIGLGAATPSTLLGAYAAPPRAEAAHMQRLLEMELAGLEPATSWVRSTGSAIE